MALCCPLSGYIRASNALIPPLEITHCAPTHNKYRKSPLNNAAWLWTDKAGVDKTSQASKELRLKLASRCVWVAINKIHQPLVTRIFILEINVTCLQSFVMWLLFLTVSQFEKQVNKLCLNIKPPWLFPPKTTWLTDQSVFFPLWNVLY